MLFDKTFVFFFNSGVRGNKRSDSLECTDTESDFFRIFFVCAISRTRFLCSVQELCYDFYVLTPSTVTFESLKGRRMRL